MLTLEAADACSCASTSLYGYADVSAYVNCEGTRPDCFERYPTDDRFDDVSDTPVSLSVFSTDGCAVEDVIGSQDTVNGQAGCTALSTSLGDVGLVVFCDLNAVGEEENYRAEMFASADCSGEPFTSVLGTADTCVDILTAGSFQVTCGTDQGDPSSTLGDEEGESESSSDMVLTVLIVVFGSILLALCGFMMYRHWRGAERVKGDGGRETGERSFCSCWDWSSSKGVGGIMDKSNSYGQL